jgi:hypothetical protein
MALQPSRSPPVSGLAWYPSWCIVASYTGFHGRGLCDRDIEYRDQNVSPAKRVKREGGRKTKENENENDKRSKNRFGVFGYAFVLGVGCANAFWVWVIGLGLGIRLWLGFDLVSVSGKG